MREIYGDTTGGIALLVRFLALLVALVVSGERTGSAAEADPLKALGARIAAFPVGADPATLRKGLPRGVTLFLEWGQVRLAFDPPVDAGALTQAWGWRRAFAVASDVHQQSWKVELFEAELEDRYGKRIAVTTPRLGAWSVEAQLDERPKGDLPGVSAGASPAYDLERYHSKVLWIVLKKAHDS